MTMSDEGWLQVSYLGTEPPEHNFFFPESKVMNYD